MRGPTPHTAAIEATGELLGRAPLPATLGASVNEVETSSVVVWLTVVVVEGMVEYARVDSIAGRQPAKYRCRLQLDQHRQGSSSRASDEEDVLALKSHDDFEEAT